MFLSRCDAVGEVAADGDLAGEGPAQDGAELRGLSLRNAGGEDRLGPVERAEPLVQLDRHARLQQAQPVLDAFVAVRVELRGGDVRRRQVGEISGPSRRRVGRR